MNQPCHLIVAFSICLLMSIPAKGQQAEFVLEQTPVATTTRKECDVNLCFALDGSSSISGRGFSQQQEIAVRVAREIGGRGGEVSYSAVQFGVGNVAITPFTTSRRDFIRAVRRARRVGGAQTFLTGGLNYCFSQVLDRNDRGNKIVLLGDGENNIGADPRERAMLFRANDADICAVGVDDPQNISVLREIAGGDPSMLFSVDLLRPDFAGTVARIVSSICD